MCASWLPPALPGLPFPRSFRAGNSRISIQVAAHRWESGSCSPAAWISRNEQGSHRRGCGKGIPPLPLPFHLPSHLPTQGRVFVQLFCSQDVPVHHVLHVGKIHQVLSIPAHRKGILALKASWAENLPVAKGSTSTRMNSCQVSPSPTLWCCNFRPYFQYFIFHRGLNCQNLKYKWYKLTVSNWSCLILMAQLLNSSSFPHGYSSGIMDSHHGRE